MSAVFYFNYDSLLPFVVLTNVAHFHSSVYYLLVSRTLCNHNVIKFSIEFPCSPNDWSDCVKTFEKTKMLKLDKVYLFKEQSIIRHFIKDKTKILPPPQKKKWEFFIWDYHLLKSIWRWWLTTDIFINWFYLDRGSTIITRQSMELVRINESFVEKLLHWLIRKRMKSWST